MKAIWKTTAIKPRILLGVVIIVGSTLLSCNHQKSPEKKYITPEEEEVIGEMSKTIKG